jgi:F-type H+-transporting ATPase subunit epsilon
MQLTVTTPEKVVLQTEVASLKAQAIDGWFGILPKHIPMVTPLKVSVLHYKTPNGMDETLAVMGGLLETNGTDINIICDLAETKTDIDVLRAQQAKTRAEERLVQVANNAKGINTDRAQLALARSIARIKTVN